MTPDHDGVLASLYEAAVTRDRWAPALQRFADLHASRGTNLVSIQPGRIDVVCSPSLTATVAQFVEQGWDRDDYRTHRTMPLVEIGFVADQHIIAPDDLKRSAYYEGFARPAGVPWYAAVGMVLPSGAGMGLSLQRSDKQGAFSSGELAKLNRMLPRLREIMLFAHRVGVEREGAILSGLDLGGQAAILFDRHGLVCQTNQAADALIGRVFSTHRRQLVSVDVAQRASLAQCIGAVCQPGRDDDAAPRTVRLEDRDGQAWIAQVAPVAGRAADVFGDSAALLILNPAFARPRSVARTLGIAYGLTAAEANVAELLAAGLDTNDIADQLRVSRNAVRFHIKSILPKANVQRQAAFVAAAAALMARARLD